MIWDCYNQYANSNQLSIDRERGRSHYNYQLSTINSQSIASGDARTTTINYRLSTINYQLSTLNCLKWPNLNLTNHCYSGYCTGLMPRSPC
ncbi:MAG: hypothetical protein ACRC62_26450 [Microcoleus sp.]